MTFLPLVRIWVWVSALATLAGWSLSVLGYLNPAGYFAFAGLAIVILIFSRKSLFGRSKEPVSGPGAHPPRKQWQWNKIGWRFRRSLPLGFAVLAALAFLGGACYPPGNHTALTYRTPRVLQWLTHEHWFWIHTPNYRMNNRACGFEWLTAPLLLFTKSDRLLFLINFVPFLLLPGLVFSVFTRIGARPRVAW